MINNTPNHIAIILDGNRRFAKKLMLEPWKGHEYGRIKVENIIEYAKSLGINELTFYALSQENIKSRPKLELEFLYKIFKEFFKSMNREKIFQNKVCFKFIGELDLLPNELKNQCLELEKDTKDHDNLRVNMAVAYGGRQELIRAIKNILKNKIKPEDLSEEILEQNLYMSNQPDLIIRTGGEKRTSNFLPWQGSYSEWIFLDKMWPEFDKEDLIDCIEQYKSRKRNFGK
ncbi:di-trans,poly-cis-decaprenylcistransferase [Candidatus Pacearchaeota archaeon]|nr:di-trans,poly-cis-decaprenylcistransferase [Candidatus Pacearchaeota archaeon]